MTFRMLARDQPSLPMATGWLLSACMEAKGKQALWTRQKPELLKSMRSVALIHSVESSNRLEGVEVEPARLKPLVLGTARPRDRSEEEIYGYRKALEWIHTRKKPVVMNPNLILRLHKMAQGGFSGDAGIWKSKDNEIIEILANGERRVRFKPVSARKSPAAIQALCVDYQDAMQAMAQPPLLVMASFVFDYLCVHPFRDGNGRVSRLLTTLLLQQNGFDVGRYVSLERLVEEMKVEYYDVLHHCSGQWHEARHTIVPWWNFYLTVLKRAHDEFATNVEGGDAPSNKSDWIRRVVLAQEDSFSLADIHAQLPAVSTPLIRKVLAQLKQEGHIRLQGRGRGARWFLK